MKRFYIFIFVMIVAKAQSQSVWGPPYPLTDSLTDNQNATLTIIPNELIQADTLYLLWERSTDMTSTSIYARNLKTMADPFPVISQSNVHFRHPRFYRWASGDTLLYVTYETDMNGNWDIYYSVVMRNLTALGPFPFIRSSLNEKSLNSFDPQTFSWEKEGKIYAHNSYSDTALLAADSCSNPVMGDVYYVCYEMATGSNTGVFFSTFDEITHTWSGSFPIDIYGTNSHLSLGNDAFGSGNLPYVFWQHNDGQNWLIKGFDLLGNSFCTFNNFNGSNNISPSFCSLVLPIDDRSSSYVDFFTFASDVSGNMQIYVNDAPGGISYFNLSNNSSINMHPQLINNVYHCLGCSGIDNNIYDIWESYRGGHWQLWASNIDFLVGDKNLIKPANGITCSPNPFSEETRFDYILSEPGAVTFEIRDCTGNKIRSFKQNASKGKNSIFWNGIDNSGSPVPSGIYIGILQSKKNSANCKIIRQ